MINEVILEGVVINTWTFSDDLFFRLASYRDPDLPGKLLNEERDAADYINARITKGARSPLVIQKGQHLRVPGLLQSREFEESLDEFIDKSRRQSRISGDINVEVKGAAGKDVCIGRNVIEILVQRILMIETPRRVPGSTTRRKESEEESPTATE